MDDQNKNLILATALSFLVILVWFLLFPPEEAVVDPNRQAVTQTADTGSGADLALAPPAETAPDQPVISQEATSAETAPRIAIETQKLRGSISLLGGRIDDLSLKEYKDTQEPDAPIVRLLSPVGAPDAYYALYGWTPGGDLSFQDVPTANTEWTVESGTTLGVDAPVTLAWSNTNGLTFRRTIAVDDEYMFSIIQSVENEEHTYCLK